jgi:D-alanine-D-alanine ligase
MQHLMKFSKPPEFSLLYVARHVHENQLTAPASSGQYPRYHGELRDLLEHLIGDVTAVGTEVGLQEKIIAASYVFSLMNRVRMKNGEVFVSTLCEYAGVPYLGASPAIRALAEDKHLAKHMIRSLGVPTKPVVPCSVAVPAPLSAPFDGPFFVKPRTGAGSEHVSAASRQDTWAGARMQAEALTRTGVEVIIEQYARGRNVTVPVVGAMHPEAFPPVVLQAEGPFETITHDDKQQREGGMRFELLDARSLSSELMAVSKRIFAEIAPVDYARMDFRVDIETGTYQFLEMNIGCDISSFGSLMHSVNSTGVSQEALVSHTLAYSHTRQKRTG